MPSERNRDHRALRRRRATALVVPGPPPDPASPPGAVPRARTAPEHPRRRKRLGADAPDASAIRRRPRHRDRPRPGPPRAVPEPRHRGQGVSPRGPRRSLRRRHAVRRSRTPRGRPGRARRDPPAPDGGWVPVHHGPVAAVAVLNVRRGRGALPPLRRGAPDAAAPRVALPRDPPLALQHVPDAAGGGRTPDAASGRTSPSARDDVRTSRGAAGSRPQNSCTPIERTAGADLRGGGCLGLRSGAADRGVPRRGRAEILNPAWRLTFFGRGR